MGGGGAVNEACFVLRKTVIRIQHTSSSSLAEKYRLSYVATCLPPSIVFQIALTREEDSLLYTSCKVFIKLLEYDHLICKN